MITIDLSKQQALDVDPEAMQQINFTGNRVENINGNTMFFITEEAKETILNSSYGTVKVLKISILFWYNINIKGLNITL